MDQDLVSQLLNNRNAFENISDIRQKLQREKNVIDSQLQAGVQAQQQLLSSGLAALQQARGDIGTLRTNMKELHTVHQDSVQSVQDFSKIQKLSTVAANFDLAQRFVDNFKTLSSDLQQINDLMDEDGEFDIDSPMQNILPVHYALSQLRETKDLATHYAENSSQDVRQTIQRHFAPLDVTVARFDKTLFDIATCLLEILRTGDRSLVVRVAKIIDAEERQDLLADVSQQVDGPKPVGSLRANSSKPRTVGGIVSRVPRHYPQRFFAAIEESIKEIFDNCMDQYSPEAQPEELLEQLDWIYSDLLQAKQQLVPCVPERWAIFDVFVSAYHQGTVRMLDSIMRFEPPAQTLLLVLQFAKTHYKTMEDAFGVPKDKLLPPLLDGREKNLYDDYLAMLVSKLEEWYATIAMSEKKPFVIRSTPPETHSDGTLGLEGNTTVFKLVNQQLEVAANSNQARILAGCVDACCEILMRRQRDWMHTVKTEVARDVAVTDSNSDEVPAGLNDYIMALLNDQSRAHEYLEELIKKWTEPLSRKYKAQVATKFTEAQSGYLDVTGVCIEGMATIIFNDTKPAYQQIFVSSKWNSGVAIGQIVDTLREYLDDARQSLEYDLFVAFASNLCGLSVVHYLRAMSHAQGKVKVPQGAERVREDMRDLVQLFSAEEYALDMEEIRSRMRVLEVLVDTLNSDLDEMSDRFLQLRGSYWDAPLDLFEQMMGLSKKNDKKELREAISRVRMVAVQTQSVANAEGEELEEEDLVREPTLLARVFKV